MSINTHKSPIPYTLGFSISEHPLSDGESVDVAFLSTVARITRHGPDDYKLETKAPDDVKTPGRGAVHGTYALFAVASTLMGCQYSQAQKATEQKADHLKADELDRCMADISSMLVNTHAYHAETFARRAEEIPVLTVEQGGTIAPLVPNGRVIA